MQNHIRINERAPGCAKLALEAHGRRIGVLNDTESKEDRVPDLTDVLTSLGARLSGPRGAAHRAKRALKAAGQA